MGLCFFKEVKALLVFFFYLGSIFSSNAQMTPNESLSYILKKQYNAHDSVQKYSGSFKRDTLLIKKLILDSRSKSYRLGESFGENMLGIYLRDISNYKEALEHHNKSLQIANNINNIEMQVSALNMTGVVYRRIDAVRSALDKHNAALQLAESQRVQTLSLTKGISISLNSIGNIYLLLRDYTAAEKYFKRAINYERTLKSDLGLAINYANLGITYEERGKFDEAIWNYKKSLEYNNIIDSDLGRVICNNSLGQVYLKQNKSKIALDLIEPTLKTAEAIGDKFYISFAYVNMGWAHSELGNYALGEKYLLMAINMAKENDLKQFLSMAYLHLSDLKDATGNYKKALEYQRLSQKVQEEYLNEANHKYVSDLIMKYDSEQKKNTIKLLEQQNNFAAVELEQSRKSFILVLAVFFLILVLLFILYRQYRLKSQKRTLSAEQKLMRSQMNPHFIFNALLSIRIYLQNHNVTEAMEYLNQFSKLIRSILSSSLEKEISLEEELETMRLYINIENIRFCNEINYSITIDPNLNLKRIKIPSLILQPFVENALWHGLQAKNGDKKLSIAIDKHHINYVNITITDNGIGRSKTMHLDSEKLNTQKKSIGINLTLKRLENFSKNLKYSYKLDVIDLYSDNNEAIGTQVKLILPLH
ncbi:tetratricopeptide repeat protein [Leeuwenhoekiella sp. MAR_2009_132]|uniref:tetratricopeptide repeat-containing sensor histidine kinase n=1 Tax=Leeuwenhoekiella sp. MAR_2009_132 TaxID=1392489 RepID=UPI0005677061|nr:tetratricopeptide repeat protein [Leeuwenhoekiella sp. MAR_2009_132]